MEERFARASAGAWWRISIPRLRAAPRHSAGEGRTGAHPGSGQGAGIPCAPDFKQCAELEGALTRIAAHASLVGARSASTAPPSCCRTCCGPAAGRSPSTRSRSGWPPITMFGRRNVLGAAGPQHCQTASGGDVSGKDPDRCPTRKSAAVRWPRPHHSDACGARDRGSDQHRSGHCRGCPASPRSLSS